MKTKEADTHQEEWRELNASPAQQLAVLEDIDFGDDEGAGMENVGADEFSIPFLVVLQANSPECKDARFGGVAGARAGMLYNKATGELFDGEAGIGLVIAARGHRFVEFFPREEDGSGGGFVGVREANDHTVERLRKEHGRFGKLPHSTDDGEPTEINEIYELYALTVPDWEDATRCSKVNVPFGSTKIKSYKDWVALALDIKYPKIGGGFKIPPSWAHKYVLRTTLRQRGSNSWYVPKVELVERPPIKSLIRTNDPVYQMASEFHSIVSSGQVTVDYAKAADEVGNESSSEEMPF